MIVPDVNLLLYATNRDMPQHERARRWIADRGLRWVNPLRAF